MIYGENGMGFNGKHRNRRKEKVKGDVFKRATDVFLAYPSSSLFQEKQVLFIHWSNKQSAT